MARRVDERGFPLSEDEQIEIDEKAKKITDSIFGDKKKDKIPQCLRDAIAQEKKKPGRPKKAIEDPVAAAPDKKSSNEIPEIVRDVITEKIDLLERMINTYDESIETLKADLTQQISDYESRKKDAGEKIRSLMSFMGGK